MEINFLITEHLNVTDLVNTVAMATNWFGFVN